MRVAQYTNARACFTKLIDDVQKGHNYIIERKGEFVAAVVPIGKVIVEKLALPTVGEPIEDFNKTNERRKKNEI